MKPTVVSSTILIVGGLIALLFFAYFAWWLQPGARFATVQGIVQNKQLEVKEIPHSTQKNYHPRIWYSFVVQGKAYEGNSTPGSNGTEEMAVSILNQYSIGSQCTVHYVTDDPMRNTIDSNPIASILPYMYFVALLGLVSVARGGIGLAKALRRGDMA